MNAKAVSGWNLLGGDMFESDRHVLVSSFQHFCIGYSKMSFQIRTYQVMSISCPFGWRSLGWHVVPMTFDAPDNLWVNQDHLSEKDMSKLRAPTCSISQQSHPSACHLRSLDNDSTYCLKQRMLRNPMIHMNTSYFHPLKLLQPPLGTILEPKYGF